MFLVDCIVNKVKKIVFFMYLRYIHLFLQTRISVRFPQSIVFKSKIWTIFASDLLLLVNKQS